MKLKLNVEQLRETIRHCADFQTAGRLVSARGVLSASLPASIGDLCCLYNHSGDAVLAEVIGFSGEHCQIMPLQPAPRLSAGATVVGLDRRMLIPAGRQLLGRVMNALGTPIDQGGPTGADEWIPLLSGSPDPMTRLPIDQPFVTGQKAIDGLLTIGMGQRVGLFAGSGVGKSTLLGEIAKYAVSDINIVVLVGERGREVRPFIQDCLGTEGLKRSIVIVSTSDEAPLVRIRAAQTAISLADWFRRRGQHVLLLLDSLTRLASAQRELGLLIGEPPSSRGFPPSTFQLMSNLIEQLGNSSQGTVTGILTVLVDGDDVSEPVADAARSNLDGHIVLDRRLAEKGHFPSIDIATSVSRLMNDVTDAVQQQHALAVRQILHEHSEVADLIRIGAYQTGTSPVVDRAIQMLPRLNRFLRQTPGQHLTLDQTRQQLAQIAELWTSPAPSNATARPANSAS